MAFIQLLIAAAAERTCAVTLVSRICTLSGVALLAGTFAVSAQTTQSQPVTDSSAQASPITSPPKTVPVDDTSAQASPIAAGRQGRAGLPPQTALHVTLGEALDSGHLKNGQTVHAKLSQSVAAGGGTSSGGAAHGAHLAQFPAGTPVVLTVVGTVPAGKINAVGELSLQLLQVGSLPVYADTLTFRGKPGHKDLPDSAPALGTDAGLPSGMALVFHVLPPPVAADGAPKQRGVSPGSVNGVASGEAPPANSGSANQQNGQTQPTGNIPSGKIVSPTTPATNSFGPAQNAGQTSVAPNQPASPAPNSSGTTSPH